MTQPEISISATGLTHAYGTHRILDDIHLEVRRGECFGFLGQNGAGKSTAIRALCGFLRPQHGEIHVAGVDVVRFPTEIRRHIGVLSEDILLYDRLSGREFLEFAGQMHGLSAAQARLRTEELLKRLELTHAGERPLGGYSLGMRKKTAFAAALIHAPQVLFLDEPFNGVDARSTHTLCALLKGLTAEKGVTVFFTSHVLEMVERLCDRAAILHDGKIVREGTISALKQEAMGQGRTLEELVLQVTGARLEAKAGLDWYGSLRQG